MDKLINLVLLWSLTDPITQIQIEKLGDDSHIVRNNASEKLTDMVLTNNCLFNLEIAREHHRDPEVRMRCRKAFHVYVCSVKPTNSKNLPWIDCLPANWENRSDYLGYIYEGIGYPNYWVIQQQINQEEEKFSGITINLVKELIDQGWTKEKIVKLLDVMVENENIWKKENGGRNQPPPTHLFKDF